MVQGKVILFFCILYSWTKNKVDFLSYSQHLSTAKSVLIQVLNFSFNTVLGRGDPLFSVALKGVFVGNVHPESR